VWSRLILLSGGFCIVRIARTACRIDTEGLLVLNPFSRRLIAWQQIARFSLGRCGLLPFAGRVHFLTGKVVPIWGIQAPNIAPDNPRTLALIARLNEELDRRR
jgi:hypothetical protein